MVIKWAEQRVDAVEEMMIMGDVQARTESRSPVSVIGAPSATSVQIVLTFGKLP